MLLPGARKSNTSYFLVLTSRFHIHYCQLDDNFTTIMESLLLKYVNNFWTVWPKTLIVCLHLKQKVKQLWGKICVRTPSKHNTNNGIEKKLTENYRNCPPPPTIFLSICWLVQRTEIISFSFPFQPNNLYRVDPDSWGNFPMLHLQSSAKSPLSPGAMSVWISESHWDLRWGDVNTFEGGLGLSSLGADIYYSIVPRCGAESAEVSWHQPIRGQGQVLVTNQRTEQKPFQYYKTPFNVQ